MAERWKYRKKSDSAPTKTTLLQIQSGQSSASASRQLRTLISFMIETTMVVVEKNRKVLKGEEGLYVMVDPYHARRRQLVHCG